MQHKWLMPKRNTRWAQITSWLLSIQLTQRTTAQTISRSTSIPLPTPKNPPPLPRSSTAPLLDLRPASSLILMDRLSASKVLNCARRIVLQATAWVTRLVCCAWQTRGRACLKSSPWQPRPRLPFRPPASTSAPLCKAPLAQRPSPCTA